MTCFGPSPPSAPSPQRNALPANAACAPSASARTTSRPLRTPESNSTVAREPTCAAIAGSDVDRRRQRLDLAAAVVRHPDAVDAERHRALGVVRMHDALEHQRPLPLVAIARDLVPGERAADLLAREADHLVRRSAFSPRIVADVGEARLAVLPAAPSASRASSASRRACADSAGTCCRRARRPTSRGRIGAHRHVDRHHQHVRRPPPSQRRISSKPSAMVVAAPSGRAGTRTRPARAPPHARW